MIEAAGFVAALFLEGVTIFYAFRSKIANANRAVAEGQKTIAEKDKIIAERSRIVEEREKTIAEKNKIIEEREKTIAEKEKLVAETELLGIDRDRKSVEVKRALLELQDMLNEENKAYQEAQHKLADLINAMAKKVAAQSDASDARNRVIKHLTGAVIDSFARYVEKASVCYRGEPAAIRASFINTEIVPFVREIAAFLTVVNEPSILAWCAQSSQPLQLTHASFGAIERCLASMLPTLLRVQRQRLIEELGHALGALSISMPEVDDERMLPERVL